MKLNNKIVLITGGGSGMGQAIAKRFSKEEAKVFITGRREEHLKETVNIIRDSGGDAECIIGDVSKWNENKKIVDAVISKYGKLDIVVTCAGIVKRTEKVEESTEEEWDEQINTNLKGTYSIIHFALPHLIKSKNGIIVAISSISSQLAAPGYATYCASKGGVTSLIRTIALQYAPNGLRANCIAPGMIQTPMAYVDRPKPFDEMVDEIVDKNYPIKRIGLPEDIANAALFLASEESSYITGQEIVVDGGFSIK